MDKEEIRELEPKYIGNTRHLTEGEAAEIMHDPANDEDENDALSKFSLAALAFAAHESGNNGGGTGSQ
ncbi:MAG: hypothetical protein K0Q90_3478 [Paenibacillaceae bacterium]|jgi:hypothetical protein|nr:hypothetical protein [Paenibacillaceae bacterium]